jgi:hypothetical protein
MERHISAYCMYILRILSSIMKRYRDYCWRNNISEDVMTKSINVLRNKLQLNLKWQATYYNKSLNPDYNIL